MNHRIHWVSMHICIFWIGWHTMPFLKHFAIDIWVYCVVLNKMCTSKISCEHQNNEHINLPMKNVCFSLVLDSDEVNFHSMNCHFDSVVACDTLHLFPSDYTAQEVDILLTVHIWKVLHYYCIHQIFNTFNLLQSSPCTFLQHSIKSHIPLCIIKLLIPLHISWL